MQKLTIICLALAFYCCPFWGVAQDADSLLNRLTEDSLKQVGATFKSTRVVLSHSSETQKKYDLDLRIRHHFGDIGGRFGGSHTLFGLDVASDLFIGLDYGITERLTAGIGRSRQDELYHLFLKYKVLQQQPDKGVPLTLTFLGQSGWITREELSANEFSKYSDRFSHFLQAIIARKFSPALSLQVMPSYLLRSKALDASDNKNLFSVGFAGRLKLTKRFSLVGDYQLVNAFGRPELTDAYYNPLGLGFEIETGGHIFSLNFMNSEYILENNFIPNTKKSWQHGGVRFGFTISRNFTLHKSKNPDTQTKIY